PPPPTPPLFPYTTLFRSLAHDADAGVVGLVEVHVEQVRRRVRDLDGVRPPRLRGLLVFDLVAEHAGLRRRRGVPLQDDDGVVRGDRKSTRLNSSHVKISY